MSASKTIKHQIAELVFDYTDASETTCDDLAESILSLISEGRLDVEILVATLEGNAGYWHTEYVVVPVFPEDTHRAIAKRATDQWWDEYNSGDSDAEIVHVTTYSVNLDDIVYTEK